MSAADVARSHSAARQTLVTAAAAEAARRWALVDRQDIARSWARQSLLLSTAVSGAQAAAASQADTYVETSLLSEGLPPGYGWAVASMSLATVTADGRDMTSLLYEPAITALMGIKSGRSVAESLASGAAQLDSMVRTEVADAGRTADQIALTTHGVPGYVRLAVGPTCNRCIILAGRWYRYSTGFQRHPNDDCIMVPAGENDPPLMSPESVYEGMTPEQRSKAGWSKDEQQAIALGADIAQVTNIHRSLYVAGGRQYTRVGAGKRPRITPRQIFREAPNDRDEQIRLLRLHRFIR